MITYSLPSWLAPCNSICHWLLCPIIWLALNTPALGELLCVPVHWLIHKQSHYNTYSHISNNKQMAIVCAAWFICSMSCWKNASFFVGLCLVLTGFISREEHLAAEVVKSAQMKDNLVFINFSMTKALVMKIQNYPQRFVIIHHACRAVVSVCIRECLTPLMYVCQLSWLQKTILKTFCSYVWTLSQYLT